MWSMVIRRFDWLNPRHPIAVRESRRIRQTLPKLIRKLSDPWTMLGYAALLHGSFFIFSLLGYSRLNSTFPNLILPFLTPFGTPIAAMILHSALYWMMQIGICNYTTHVIASDMEGGTWRLLRTTPYLTQDILLAKVMTVVRVWAKVLRILVIVRLVILAFSFMAIASQVPGENATRVALDPVNSVIFVVQPLVDAFLAASLSVLAGVLIPNSSWSKAAAYSMVALVSGGLGGIGSFWLIFKSSVGVVAGLLVPLNHWAPIVAVLSPTSSPAQFAERTLVFSLTYLIAPLVLGVWAFAVARRLSERIS
jgi:hypothetical protein